MPLFRSVHSTVGDAQDLAQGLSTFSAHVAMLRDIAASAGRNSLVLIDEIAADTDPREGAAIAIAVLEELLTGGAVVLVTTHLEELKALAHLDPRFLNARVGFDAKRMAPTYKLQTGRGGCVVGHRRGGAHGAAGAHLRARARPGHATRAARWPRRWRPRRRSGAKLHDELERAKVAAEEAERLRAQLEEQSSSSSGSARRGDAPPRRVAAASDQAATEVQELLKVLRSQSNEKAAAEARAELLQRAEEANQRAKAARAELFQVEAPPPAELKVGAWVRHSGLDKDVEILELTGDQALVAAGILKMRVPVSELSGSRTAKAKEPKFPERNKQVQRSSRRRQAAPEAVEATNYRCDVRGMRAEDALREVESFLDRGCAAARSPRSSSTGTGPARSSRPSATTSRPRRTSGCSARARTTRAATA